MSWKDKNFGKHPADPDYLDGYDPDEDCERYELEHEMKQMAREGN